VVVEEEEGQGEGAGSAEESAEVVVTAVEVRSHFVIGDTQVSIGRQIVLKDERRKGRGANRRGKCECKKKRREKVRE
jgi:hypothetical protein